MSDEDKVQDDSGSQGDPPATNEDEKQGDSEPFDEVRWRKTLDAHRETERRLKDEKRELQGQLDVTKTKLTELENKVSEFEDKDKSEVERLTSRVESLIKERDDYKAQVEAAQQRYDTAILEYEVRLTASEDEHRLQDPEDALRYIAISEIERDDDGKPKPAAIKRKLKELLESKPYLAVSTEPLTNGKSRVKATPRGDDTKALSDEETKNLKDRNARRIRTYF